MTSPLLEVKDLHTHFFTESGVVRAVDGVSFDLLPGTTLGVLGESGCGKSVTGFSILHLIAPPGRIVRGEIIYHGSGQPIDLLKYSPGSEAMRRVRGKEIAMIFQEPMTSLDPLFNVGNQLSEAILVHERISKKAARDRSVELLDKVRLPQPRDLLDKYPHQLSGGMRQRVMIAMALACQPKLLIADEPTTALDATTEAQILDLLRSLQAEFRMAMMFITHDLGVIAEMAERVIVMYLGRIVEQTDVQALFDSPKHPYTQALLASIPQIGRKTGAPLRAIEGMVPSPFNIPKGCPFNPRCQQIMPGLCDVRYPALMKVGADYAARCFLYGEETEGERDTAR